MGNCSSRVKQAAQRRDERRRLLREQYLQEQAQWREQRLHQVVRVLVDRGEVEEGVALAFQLPNRAEVLARRPLRLVRASERERLALVEAESERRLDEEGRAITRKTLGELLAHGRPLDAEPGPDIMRLLLDGQEVRPHTSSDEDERSDEFVDLPPPSPPPGHPLRPPPTSSADSSDGPTLLPESPEAQRALRASEARRRREEAIIRELHEKTHPRRRRKTAEELYGAGIPYVVNPTNKDLDRSMAEAAKGGTGRRPLTNDEPQSALMRFLSPLTPWRGRRRKAQAVSAFENRQPTEPGDSPAGSPTKPTLSPTTSTPGRLPRAPVPHRRRGVPSM